MTLPRFTLALAALTIATSLVTAGYILGTRHSTADELARIDEIRQTAAVCSEAVRIAERTLRQTEASQETWRLTVGAWLEARESGFETVEVEDHE